MLCSCGRNSRVCPGAYTGDKEHDDLVLAKANRPGVRTFERSIDPSAMQAGRLWQEVADIERERALTK